MKWATRAGIHIDRAVLPARDAARPRHRLGGLGIDTSDTTDDVVRAYYDTIKEGTASFDPDRLRAILADAEMPGGTVRFAEFFQLGEGRIQSLRLLYDAASYRAKGGR